MTRVHRDKVFRALDMLAEGRTTREVVEELGLSFTQLRELREILPQYIEVRELGERLRGLNEEYLRVLQKYRELMEELESLKQRAEALREEAGCWSLGGRN